MNIDEAVDPAKLEILYQRIKTSRYDMVIDAPRMCPGSDRVQLEIFDRDRAQHFRAIQRKVLDGRYTFAPFLETEIPKPGSPQPRIISVASIRDVVVQRAAYECIYDAVDSILTDSVYGYRRGRTAHAAVTALRSHLAAGMLCVFDADFSGFFDNVSHDVLMAKVQTLTIDERLQRLIYRFIKTRKVLPAATAATKSHKGSQRCFPGTPRIMGVPQGGILSGLLTNLYLAEFDREMLRHSPGYVRYADDFVVCCESSDACHECRASAEEFVKPLKISFNNEKTKTCVLAHQRGVQFLGFTVRPHRLSVRPKNVARFKARIRGVIEAHTASVNSSRTLTRLCNKLAFKIRGPDKLHREKLIAKGLTRQPGRRSWIGFFRVVDDLAQIRSLDNWIRRQVSAYMWDTHQQRVGLTEMQKAGLPSLVNHLYRARKAGV